MNKFLMFTLRVLACAISFTATLAELVDETEIMTCVVNSKFEYLQNFDLEFEGYESQGDSYMPF